MPTDGRSWSRVRPTIALAAGVLLVMLLGSRVRAVPRYAVAYRQSCTLCHYDPSGGGMRSAYAAQYIVPTELARYSLPAEQLERLDPAIGENISIGFDLRTMFHYDDDRNTQDNFLQMQGDVYLAFQLDDRFCAYFDRGMSGTYEVFGTAYVLPANGYLRVGRFVPPYGWRLADHTAFVRELQGFAPPGHTDVGLEAGISPGPWSLQAAVLNGAPGLIRDTDHGLAGAARASVRLQISPVALWVGGSIYRRDSHPGDLTLAGPFLGAGLGLIERGSRRRVGRVQPLQGLLDGIGVAGL